MRRESGVPTTQSWKSVARWPVFLLANAALLLVIGASTIRETYRGWTVDHEIRALEAQAASLEGRKSALETLTKDLVSNDRVEYEARARLDLKKAGERVIILEGTIPTGTWKGEGAQEPIMPTTYTAEESNASRWLRYFFHD